MKYGVKKGHKIRKNSDFSVFTKRIIPKRAPQFAPLSQTLLLWLGYICTLFIQNNGEETLSLGVDIIMAFIKYRELRKRLAKFENNSCKIV